MNELERRTLLGAAGVGALAAFARAGGGGGGGGGGPLSPPPGPVSPSGRTLDEIYNRLPDFAATQLDGRTPIGADGGITQINDPGSYVLVRSITSAGTTVHISADDVTIDLNGFTISSSHPAAFVVFLNSQRSRVRIRNGAITGGGTGVSTGGASTALVFENVHFSQLRVGIGATNPCRGAVIRGCTFVDMGASTVATDGSLTIAGIDIAATASRIEECAVNRLFYNGAGTPTFRGIRASGAANIVSRCTVSHDAAITGSGLALSSTATYRDNTVLNFSTPYSGGIAGTGNL